MKINTFAKLFSIFALIAAVALTMPACDTTDANDDPDDHADAVGFVIIQNNIEILRFEDNNFQLNPEGTWDDYFRQYNGNTYFTMSPDVIDDMDRGMNPSVTIRWLDHEGDLFDLPEEADGGEFRLEWDWEKPNTLTGECNESSDRENPDELDLIRPANIEQHGSDGSWGFHFRADHAGTDRIRFRLIHNPDTDPHADFVSGWMTLVVAHDDHDQIDENGIYLHERDKCRTR